MKRRSLIKKSIVSLAAAPALLRAATPSQPEGPFHPVNIDNDLRQRPYSRQFAMGQQIKVFGTVVDSKTKIPIKGVLIEIWQADHQGKYDHPNDPLEVSPDPDFQFWGRAGTDRNGNYSFLSIKPGSYPAGGNWERPPHIHLKFSRRGYEDLTTQIYFAGEPLNDVDKLLQRLSIDDQKQLIIDFQRRRNNIKEGEFLVELDKV